MRRREFITLFGGALAGWPRVAGAQQAGMIIGMLHSQTQESEAPRLSAVQQGLRETGFEVGRNVTIEHRFADGHNDRLPALAADLVRRRVNVIVANTTPPAMAAKAATSTIPVVFITGVDPVEVGLVASMNRPGGNLTGVTFLSNKLVAKRLELLADLTPRDGAIGMLAAQKNPNTETDVRDALAAAKALGRTLHVVKLPPDGDINEAIAALVQQRVGALFVAPQADFRMWRQQLVLLAARYRLPTSFSSSDHVAGGALMSYGPDQMESYHQAAVYAGRILKGETPGRLPVMQSTKFEFAINLKTAKALDIAIPAPMLALATSIVE
jgi:putative ABC transport system substrate-binding protein